MVSIHFLLIEHTCKKPITINQTQHEDTCNHSVEVLEDEIIIACKMHEGGEKCTQNC